MTTKRNTDENERSLWFALHRADDPDYCNGALTPEEAVALWRETALPENIYAIAVVCDEDGYCYDDIAVYPEDDDADIVAALKRIAESEHYTERQ